MLTRNNSRPTTPIDYPDGLFVDAGEHTYYVRGGKRYRVYSKRALQSWAATPVRGSEQSLARIPRARTPLGFRDGTLIHNYADGKLYLISGNKRRHIKSPDVLRRLRIRESDAIVVSQQETDLHDEGDSIN
jgi:hypothetical protein